MYRVLVWGLGFGVYGSRSRVRPLRSRVRPLRSTSPVWGPGFDLSGLGVRGPDPVPVLLSPDNGYGKCYSVATFRPPQGQEGFYAALRPPPRPRLLPCHGGGQPRVRVLARERAGEIPGTHPGYLLTVLVLTLNRTKGTGLG